jgi:hypothetical protein
MRRRCFARAACRAWRSQRGIGRTRARIVLLALVTAIACCARRPELDPSEHVRGERRRVVPVPVDRLWPRVVAALGDEGIRIGHADAARGAIATRPVHLFGSEASRRLSEIADLSRAHQEGFGRVSELEVRYFVLVAAAGDAGSSVRVRSAISAVDRDVQLLGGGLFNVIPHRIDVPSRGVVEQELLRRLAADVFTAEEVFLLLGEPGVD